MAEQLPDRLAAALRELTSAIDLLEAAAERQARAEARRADLEDEFALAQEDRSRLASELDGALAYAARLSAASLDVECRLRGAGDALKELVGPCDAGATSSRAS